MAIIKKLNGHTPKFGKNCFLADNAAIIGDVEMGNELQYLVRRCATRRCTFHPDR